MCSRLEPRLKWKTHKQTNQQTVRGDFLFPMGTSHRTAPHRTAPPSSRERQTRRAQPCQGRPLALPAGPRGCVGARLRGLALRTGLGLPGKPGGRGAPVVSPQEGPGPGAEAEVGPQVERVFPASLLPWQPDGTPPGTKMAACRRK